MDAEEFDLFEAEYAEDLAAMEDMEAEGGLFPPACKPKRTLDFATPSHKRPDLNDSDIVPLNDDGDSSNINTDDEIAREKCRLYSRSTKLLTQLSSAARNLDEIAKKRKGSNEKDSTNETQPNKRLKTTTGPGVDIDDDFDITPPPSPPPRDRRVRSNNPLDELNDRIMLHYDYDRPRVLNRIPLGDFVSLTTAEGSRYYMAVSREKDRFGKARVLANKAAGLLPVQYAELKRQALEQRRLNLEEATAQAIDNLDSSDHDSANEDHPGSAALWVERYTPRSYIDLLSDESTNRTLLHWLRLWDHVVFGREVKKKERRKELKKSEKFQKKDLRNEQLEAEMELDSLNRPFHKVVLLCGPPGLGKTTLAHVLARHSGYNVIEINASDDRSAETFKNKVDSAIHMRAVIGQDPRPNCLVIDEIDGAPLPAINQLLSLVRAGTETDTDKKKKKKSPLLRPIICICNDQYTPALRQLRAQALLLHFPQTMSTKLAGRLLDICQREGLKADQSTLLALCSKTDNDIRSCINTLQFFRGKKRDLMLRDIQGASLAQKDVHKSLFTVWHEIFQQPKQNRRGYVNPYDRASLNIHEMAQLNSQQNNTSASSRFYHIHSLVSGVGENDKIAMGLFDNYLNMNIKDPRMHGITLASDWLCDADVISAHIGQTQNYALMPYLPYTMVLFHLLFAANQVNKIQFPNSYADYRSKLSTSQSVVASLMDDMSTSIRHHLNMTSVVLDVLPPLMDIIQPSFRPINTQLYSSREKADLHQLIRVMIGYNMTYRQEKSVDGQYNYILEPHVDAVVRFPGLKQRRQMTYAAKQLVAREIDLEKMRRTDVQPEPSKSMPAQAKQTNVPPAVPNHQKKLQARAIDEKELVTKDFFGRRLDSVSTPVINTTKKSNSHDDSCHLLSRDVWYHFKEGYSNAVRKSVRMRDLN